MPKYNFRTEDDFAAELRRQNIQIPLDHDTSILGEKVRLPGGRVLSNRLVIQPVECHDSEPDGSPSEYTFGRYRRYAAGGAGVVWIEACAVSADARGHGRMLYINDDNIVKFRKLAAGIRAAAKRSGSTEPYIILQLHYSGRFGRRHDIVFHNDYLDSQSGVEPDQHVLTDEELSTVGQQFIDAAVLSEDAGFDAVDVKCCHGYLLSELLSGFAREAVAYPGFPKDIINTGGFVSGKECVLCDGCIRCIEAEKRVVCVVRAE